MDNREQYFNRIRKLKIFKTLKYDTESQFFRTQIMDENCMDDGFFPRFLIKFRPLTESDVEKEECKLNLIKYSSLLLSNYFIKGTMNWIFFFLMQKG